MRQSNPPERLAASTRLNARGRLIPFSSAPCGPQGCEGLVASSTSTSIRVRPVETALVARQAVASQALACSLRAPDIAGDCNG